MAHRLLRLAERTWRRIATAICFTVFGLGGVLLGLTVFPLLHATTRRPVAVARVQRAVSAAFRLFIGLMRGLGVLTYEVHGRERLQVPGRLVIANHPSLIDVVFLISLLPQVDCIVKQGLWRNPFLRWPVVWAGYISNSTGERLIEDAARALRSGRSLVIFPEGTRTMPGRPLAMKRGAAQIALAARADIVPVTITCTPETLHKKSPWYRVPPVRPHWKLSIGEPIRAAQFITPDVPPGLAARRLTSHFERYFTAAIAAQSGGADHQHWPSAQAS